MKKPIISIIVPTFNSSKKLNYFLGSLVESSFKDFEVIINDDLRTNDTTPSIIEKFEPKLSIKYLRDNIMMAQARKAGAAHAEGSILIHLDSDMQITPNLLEECRSLIRDGYDALVIPEESFGSTFWAKCKRLEKKMYENNINIESLRCLKTDLYNQLNGHNVNMIFSEDKDLDLRARARGISIGRTKNKLKHDEGDLKLFNDLLKKLGYSNTSSLYAREHSAAFKWQANPLNRYKIFLKNYRLGLSQPLVYLGLYFMKTSEYAFSALGVIRSKLQ